VGELGVSWKRSLESAGLEVDYHPLNPRTLKVSRGGRVLIPPERLPAPGPLTLIACGTQGNRDLLRTASRETGLVEGEAFWCVG
jgi:hypothetical protein